MIGVIGFGLEVTATRTFEVHLPQRFGLGRRRLRFPNPDSHHMIRSLL